VSLETLSPVSVSKEETVESDPVTELILKKAFSILAVVAGYSLFEAGLLLSTIQPGFWNDLPLRYVLVVFWGQLVVIPGFAVLFSRLMYGREGWKRRGLTIVAVGSIGLIAVFAALFGVALALDRLVSLLYYLIPSWMNCALASIASLGVVFGIIFALWAAFKRAAKKSVELESARWLIERQSGIDMRQRSWRSRAIAWALCIRSITVLALFAFLPEVVGLVSNLRQPHTIQLGGYTIRVPSPWIIFSRGTDNETGRSFVSGIAGIGAQLDFRTYFHGRVPVTSWLVEFRGSDPPPRPAGSRLRASERRLAQRVISIGRESVTCVEYTSPYYEHPSAIGVECSGSHLYAGMRGEQRHLNAFYRMLEQATMATK
jgi:hypothetical protein